MKPSGEGHPVSSSAYLTLVNCLCAGVGLCQAILVSRALSPAVFGVIALVVGVVTVVGNVVDCRVTDVAAKLYHPPQPGLDAGLAAYRAGVGLVCLGAAALLALVAWLLGFLVSLAAVPLLTDAPVGLGCLLAQSFVTACNSWTNSLGSLYRLSGRFFILGTSKALTQLGGTGLVVLFVLRHPTLESYFLGQTLAAFSALLGTLGLWGWIWKGNGGSSPRGAQVRAAARDFVREARMLLFGNLLGYSQMIHRGADVLLVGALCDDHLTGLYRLARALTDKLYLLFDAMHQVYYPHFLGLLARHAHQQFGRLARRLFVLATAATLATLLLEVLLLPGLIRALLSERFLGATGSVVILTLPILLMSGIHLWLWPLLVSRGRLGTYTAATILGAAAQVLVSVLLLRAYPGEVVMAALGFLAYELVVYGVTLASLVDLYLPALSLPARHGTRGTPGG